MKTSRIKRIFMMGIATIALAILRIFRKFTKLQIFSPSEDTDTETPVHPVDSTRPERLGIKPELEVDGEIVEKYSRPEPIYFEPDAPYGDIEGVPTFRGDNLRTGAAYGTAKMPNRKFGKVWSFETGRLEKGYGKGFWTGSGWTGQPLLVRWSEDARKKMDMFPSAKEKKGLIEAVYSTMDGNLYFLDAQTGERTREDVHVGLPFKGAGALYPSEKTPMVFLGAGDSGKIGCARNYTYSLIDNQKLFEFGADDPFAPRIFHGFDSSPLVHIPTDTLIEPSENGIIYTFRMGTVVDAETGKVSVAPTEKVKLRYTTSRSSEKEYWLGMEDSAVAWKNYLYIADNGGNLLAIDINTMEVIWAQDVEDDTNGSPVFAVEDGVPYIYIATSLHWKASKLLRLADVPIFKINAITGEYVWIRRYFCNTIAGVSGGIQATAALGRGEVADLVIFPVARTPQVRGGIVVALNRKSGEEVWRFKLDRYAWSSPSIIYDEDGHATVIVGDSVGNLFLLDAKTGKELDRINLGSNIEASPAVFENRIVVGTRGQKIFGIELI